MQKKKRKKHRSKTKIRPLKTQKVLKFLRKINKNQKIASTHFERFWAPKTSPKGTPKAPQNDPKTNKKTTQKKNEKKSEKRAKMTKKT